ncbi:MAG TPA: hypothetical protein EYP40_07590, partial [Chromatiales bacterium]|nr:hypothetical protein [Chromatiales bacterium]
MPFLLRLQRLVLYSVVMLVVTAAVLLSIARVLVSDVETYRLDVEQLASAFLDHPVRIDSMDARFVGLTPTLVFENVRMLDNRGERELISFREARLGIALFASLKAEKLIPGDLVIDGVNFNIIRQQDGQIRIQGIDFGKFSTGEPVVDRGTSAQLSDWLFHRSRLVVRNGSIVWDDFKLGISRRFDNVNLQLANEESNHFLRAEITLPPAFGRKLEIAVVMHGDMLSPAYWQGELYLNADGLRLGAWGDALWLQDVDVSTGLLNLKLWASLDKGRLRRLSGDVSLYNLAMQAGFLDGPLGFDRAAGRFDYRASQQGWTLDVEGLQFIEGDTIWPATRLHAAQAEGKGEQPDRLEFIAEYLPLDKITNLALKTRLLAEPDRQRLQQARPVGAIRDLRVRASLTGDRLTGPYHVQARFDQLGIDAAGARPGFQGLSGTLWANQDGGRMQLDSGSSALEFGTLFRAPLPLRRLNGSLWWQKQPAGWQIGSDDLIADTPHIQTRNRFLLTLPAAAGVAPYLDLQTTFRDGDGAHTSVYVPAGIMDPDLVHWLDTAIRAGHVIEGGAIFNGRLADFPFEDNQGQFLVYFSGEDIQLDYAAGWPAATGVRGEATFTGRGVEVEVDSGRLLNSQIGPTRVTIPSFNAGILKLDGTVSGSLHDTARFLTRSPIAPDARSFVDTARISGKARTRLQLRLPLSEQAAARAAEKYSGTTTITGGNLHLYDNRLDITQLEGAIAFSDRGLAARDITGRIMGQSATFEMFTRPGEGGRETIVTSRTRLVAEPLQRRFKVARNRVSGSTPLQASLTLGRDAQGKTRPPRLQLHSDLEGMALNMPAPMIKPAASKRPLRVTIDFAGIDDAVIRIDYAGQFGTALAMHGDSLNRIAVHFGPGPPEPPQQRGIRITGAARQVSLAPWRGFLDDLWTEDTGSRRRSPLPIVIDMQLLEVAGTGDA